MATRMYACSVSHKICSPWRPSIKQGSSLVRANWRFGGNRVFLCWLWHLMKERYFQYPSVPHSDRVSFTWQSCYSAGRFRNTTHTLRPVMSSLLSIDSEAVIGKQAHMSKPISSLPPESIWYRGDHHIPTHVCLSCIDMYTQSKVPQTFKLWNARLF